MRDSLRPRDGRRTASSKRTPGMSGARISQSARGAPYGRTTATTVTPGASFHMIMRDPAPTDGTKTAWLVCQTFGMTYVSPWPCGTASTRSVKERMFGLTGPQGNHGEDVKEYWWYLDGLPSHAWLRWRYHYPQEPFPYQRLIDENARRSRDEPEFELMDTGVFDHGRYWAVDVEYAKASPTEVLAKITIKNHASEEATLSVLPTLWFHNTWQFTAMRPQCCSWMGTASSLIIRGSPAIGWMPRRRPAAPVRKRCSVTTKPTTPGSSELLPITDYPKDGINDHVITGASTVNPNQRGTKASWWYKITVAAGGEAEIRLRLHRGDQRYDCRMTAWHGSYFDTVMADREREADEFYAALAPDDIGEEEDAGTASVVRGPDLEQTDVSVSGIAMAGRGSGSTTPAARTSIWSQFGLAPS